MAEEFLIVEHPALKNAVILDNIFRHVPSTSLKDLRLVSKAWLDAAKKFWRQVAIVRINGNDQLLNFIDFSHSAEATAQLESLQKFVMTGVKFGEAPHFESFWNRFGPSVKHLELTRCNCNSMYHFREILYKCCPNMEYLTLNRIPVKDVMDLLVDRHGKRREPLPLEHLSITSLTVDHNFNKTSRVLWRELLTHFPRLAKFKTLTENFSDSADKGSYAAMNRVRRLDNTKLNLKKLFVRRECEASPSKPFPDSLLKLLTDANIHLTKLSFSLNCDNDVTRLRNVLEQHCSSLTVLHLDGRRCKRAVNPVECFGSFRLEHLEELTLEDRVFTTLEVLKYTPILKKLAIMDARVSNIIRKTMVANMSGVVLKNCTDLYVRAPLLFHDVETLPRVMPYVDTLKMELNSSTFEAVCRHWTDLVSLEIIHDDGDLDDEAITGFEKPIVNLINESHGSNTPHEFTYRTANITDLERLRKLVFRCVPIWTDEQVPFPLGFCSALHGIHELPNLKLFQIFGYENLDLIKNGNLRKLWTDLLKHFS